MDPLLGETSSPADQPTPPPAGWRLWHLALAAAAAGIALGAVGITMSRSVASSAPTLNLAARSPRAAEDRTTPTPSDSVGSSPAPKWARIRQSGWASDGSRTIGFELRAENDVRVWMKRVRPVLVVRCLGRQTEVFVTTGSAMSIESTPDRHTVHIGFDGQADIANLWLDSEADRHLFAPDGIALARQLARAHTMRFGFTPFNASPVVAEFDVRGFGGPLESVARTCGWSAAARVAAGRSRG